MRKVIGAVLLLGIAAYAVAQDGPLTNLANIPIRTDANGYVIAAAQTYSGPDGPRRVLSNTLGRTDANGYLIVTNPTGFGSPLDAQYWVGAANSQLTAEKNLGALATALVVNTAGVPSAYAGVTCTNQVLRALSAVGASTCATVSLTADVTGTLPLGNGGTGSTLFTAGSVVFSNGTILTQDNANIFWNDSDNRLGIGTAAPTGALTVSGNTTTLPAVPVAGTVIHVGGADSGQVSLALDGFAAAPQLIVRRAQGTNASPSALGSAGFGIFNLVAIGYGTSAYSTPQGFLSYQTSQAWTNSAQGTKLIFSVTADGATTPTDRIWLLNDGKFGVGTDAPGSLLSTIGGLSVGATYGIIAAPTSGAIIEGNVGIGTSSIGTGFAFHLASGDAKLFTVGIGSTANGGSYPHVGYNIRRTASANTWAYDAADTASNIQFFNGGFIFRGTSTVGVAGNNITFTQVADISSVGNMGLGSGSNTSARLTVGASQSGKTTLGNARQLLLDNTNGGNGERLEIGMGYRGATYQPVIMGHLITANSNLTKGNWYVATRDVETDTAPTERLTATAIGNILIGAPTQPTTGSQGLIFADGTALATMGSNTAGFFADDVSGTVNIFAINESGDIAQITGTIRDGAVTVGGSCGTSPSIVGNNTSGKVTTGSVAPTSCTVTFSSAWVNAPSCNVTNETTANLARATSTTTTVELAGTFVAGDVLAYQCLGY